MATASVSTLVELTMAFSALLALGTAEQALASKPYLFERRRAGSRPALG